MIVGNDDDDDESVIDNNISHILEQNCELKLVCEWMSREVNSWWVKTQNLPIYWI